MIKAWSVLVDTSAAIDCLEKLVCWMACYVSTNPAARVGHYTRTVSTSTQNASVWSLTAAAPSDSVFHALCTNSLTYLLTLWPIGAYHQKERWQTHDGDVDGSTHSLSAGVSCVTCVQALVRQTMHRAQWQRPVWIHVLTMVHWQHRPTCVHQQITPSEVDKWVAGPFNRMCALWRHLVSACEVKAHLIGCWQYLGAVCFCLWAKPGCGGCPAWQIVVRLSVLS